jgi:hypothetical protein
MASFKARVLDAMVMFTPDSLLAPVAAGTLRGPKYSRLLVSPRQRRAQRSVAHVSAGIFDMVPPGTNRNDNEACDLAVNVYARTRLRYALVADNLRAAVGDSVSVQVRADVLRGTATTGRALARLISPVNDLAALGARLNAAKVSSDALNRDQRTPRFDAARALAEAERKDRRISGHRDQQMTVAVHDKGSMHVHIEKTPVAGAYNLSVYIEGEYCPDHDAAPAAGGHSHAAAARTRARAGGGAAPTAQCGPDCARERFVRLLTTLLPVTRSKRSAPPASRRKRGRGKVRRIRR